MGGANLGSVGRTPHAHQIGTPLDRGGGTDSSAEVAIEYGVRSPQESRVWDVARAIASFGYREPSMQ